VGGFVQRSSANFMRQAPSVLVSVHQIAFQCNLVQQRGLVASQQADLMWQACFQC
jgi:hypothetical protein